MLETLPSKAAGGGSVPGRRAGMPHVPGPKTQYIKKLITSSSVVTNSTRIFKMVLIKKKLFKRTKNLNV